MTNKIVEESLSYEVNPKFESDAYGDKSNEKEESNFDFAKIFLINENNWCLGYWTMLDITCCLLSSYFYAWLSYFGIDISDDD